jgi:hypothetical protein
MFMFTLVRVSVMLTFIVAVAVIGLSSLTGSATAHGSPSTTQETPDNLAVPSGSVLLFELDARGVQIYACEADPDDATAYVWTFKAPEAELLNAHGEVVGSHFGGPTWQGHDGSAVVSAVLERADAPAPDAIPWLLLEAKEHTGSGIFSTVTYVQRLDTTGGVAPAGGCDESHAGEEIRVPYEATYAFAYPAAPEESPAMHPPTSTPAS